MVYVVEFSFVALFLDIRMRVTLSQYIVLLIVPFRLLIIKLLLSIVAFVVRIVEFIVIEIPLFEMSALSGTLFIDLFFDHVCVLLLLSTFGHA